MLMRPFLFLLFFRFEKIQWQLSLVFVSWLLFKYRLDFGGLLANEQVSKIRGSTAKEQRAIEDVEMTRRFRIRHPEILDASKLSGYSAYCCQGVLLKLICE